MNFLVTTDINRVPTDRQIVMVDGTVPKWAPKDGDLYFDHHLGEKGAPIQILDIPDGTKTQKNCFFVTTQIDADACCAAAWLALIQLELDPAMLYSAKASLIAISYDCDHLGCPESKEFDPYRQFARNAVAALKEVGSQDAIELGLPSDRRAWTEDQKVEYSSLCFERGVEWLIAACLGDRPFPGELGEADAYFQKLESQRQKVYANCRLYRGCALFDQRPFAGEYVDPRLLVEWARETSAPEPITLTIRDGSGLPNAKFLFEFNGPMHSYTLGSIPLHSKGSPRFSKNQVWAELNKLEIHTRRAYGQPAPDTLWGGRNEVGGSSWRDPAIVGPENIVDCVLVTIDAE